jgi:hypothetical protein
MRIVGGCVAGMLMAATPVQVLSSSMHAYPLISISTSSKKGLGGLPYFPNKQCCKLNRDSYAFC